MWTGLGIAAAGIGGALIGANASKSAANTQGQATERGVEESQRQYDTSRADLAPYREAGTAALARLRALLNIDSGSPESSPLLRKFTKDDLNADPVYNSGLEFGLDEGRKAIERRAASTGGYDSGAALKALTRYGSDYGSTKAEGAYGRFVGNQGDVYGRLSGVAGLGAGETNVGVNANSNQASNLASLYTGQGNASAASQIAGANAITGGINNAAGYFGQMNLLQQLQGGGARTLRPDTNLTGGGDLVGPPVG